MIVIVPAVAVRRDKVDVPRVVPGMAVRRFYMGMAVIGMVMPSIPSADIMVVRSVLAPAQGVCFFASGTA